MYVCVCEFYYNLGGVAIEYTRGGSLLQNHLALSLEIYTHSENFYQISPIRLKSVLQVYSLRVHFEKARLRKRRARVC
jgi:hypothetical protein